VLRMRTKSAMQILIFALPACSWCQTTQGQEKLTAREMFYAAREESSTPKAVKPGKPKSQQAVPSAPASNAGAVPNVRTVSAVLTGSAPFGLRYTILKKNGDQASEVSPGSVFHSGDRIRLGVDVSDNGFLYIVSQGSSGNWTVLFPSSEIEKGDNRVDSGHHYVVPQGQFFSFTGDPGVEKLFVILSRQPVQEMDQLIYSIQNGHEAPAEQPAKETPNIRVLRAAISPVQNSFVDSLRTSYSRDLIVEKVDSDQQDKAEKAVYVVKPSGSPDSRVVADIPLNHQ
jgi:hypothetical protein